MKKILILVLFFVVLGPFFAPPHASADTLDASRRVELLLQINDLLVQIQELQRQLLEQKFESLAHPVSRNSSNYTVKYFDNDFESEYQIINSSLVPFGGGGVRNVDSELWALWRDVVGSGGVADRIEEFRVAKKDNDRIGAFIELKSGTDNWVLGVNRADFESGNDSSKRVYRELFIHEYAHIIAYYYPDLVENFEKEFWTDADKARQVEINTARKDEAVQLRDAYFEENMDRFISDYAMISPDEDFAETFLEFVVIDRPSSSEEVYEKMLFMYQDDTLLNARTNIRKNLGF